MKDQLITYGTAELAKEKGFENKTPHKLRRDYYNHLGEINGDVTQYVKAYVHKRDTTKLKTIDAPTQSLLQKWLREEHNLHILMNVGMNDGVKQTFYCNIFKFGKNLYVGKFRSETSIYTYEEALEKGLIEALKLI